MCGPNEPIVKQWAPRRFPEGTYFISAAKEDGYHLVPKLGHDLAPHCDDPGCTRGVVIGICRRCGATGVGRYEECPGLPERPA